MFTVLKVAFWVVLWFVGLFYSVDVLRRLGFGGGAATYLYMFVTSVSAFVFSAV